MLRELVRFFLSGIIPALIIAGIATGFGLPEVTTLVYMGAIFLSSIAGAFLFRVLERELLPAI